MFEFLYNVLRGNHPTLTGVLPYRVFDENEGLYINSKSYGFILELTPMCGAGHDVVKIITGMLTDGVPEGCGMQIMNWASPFVGSILDRWSNARKGAAEIYKRLAERRVAYYGDKNWTSFFSTASQIRDFRVFAVVSIPEKYGLKGKQQLLDLRAQLTSTLQSAGIHSIQLLPKQLLELMTELLNPTSSMIKENVVSWNKVDSLSDHLLDSARSIEVYPQGLRISNQGEEVLEVRSFSVRSFPEVWAQWHNRDLIGDFYSDFLRLACPVLTVFSFTYGNDERQNDNAQIKALRATQKASSGIGRFLPSVYAEDQDWRFVVDKLKRGQKMVKAFYQVTIYAKPEEIEYCERCVKSLYQSKGWMLSRDQFVQMQTFLAGMPFTISEGLGDDLFVMGRMKSMVTWSCANLAPLQGEWKGMKAERMMLVGRRGQLFYWDPFDNPSGNYNVAVVGKSGSGKSVFMQELVSALVGAGGQVIVIDDGRSFMHSCLLQEGQFLEFGGSDICINPFSIISQGAFERNPQYKDEVVHLLNLIVRQMCRAQAVTSDIENAFIQDAIADVWQNKSSSATMTDVAEALLSHQDARASDLGKMMKPFTKTGLYARFFEGKSNISLEQAFFVFEFDKIKSKPDLQRVVLMVLIFLVSEKMFHGDRSRTVSLVIDEAWSLLHGSHFAEFIEGIARRARKYNGNIVTGTQSMDDYYKNPAATAAIQNTDWFCLLAQNRESVESMQKLGRISMTEEMEKALCSLKVVANQYSEVMIYGASTGWAIGRLILDPYSIALYSSKGQEFAKIKELQKKGLSLNQALEEVASGISITLRRA